MSEKSNNILDFPGKTSNDDEKYKSLFEDVPEGCKNTGSYFMSNVLYSFQPLETVPDIQSGGQRNKRWGVSLSIGIIPRMEQTEPGPVVLPPAPSQFFDADSLEELKARVYHELEKSFDLAEMAVNDPEKYEQYQREMTQKFEDIESMGTEDGQ